MLRALDPLTAYRTDLQAAPDVVEFGAADGQWLLLAELLARRTSAPPSPAIDGDLRDVLRGLLAQLEPAAPPDDVPGPDGGWTPDDAVTAVGRVAASMEDAGALHLAAAVLRLCEVGFPDGSGRARGLLLAQRARVARGLGALEAAHDLYAEAARVGAASSDVDVTVRATLGQAVVARRRGNYPASRARYRRALRLAERAGLPELAGLAHHGLLIAAGAAGDTDGALHHGWRALGCFRGKPDRQADVLANLGAVGRTAGHYAAGLGAYLWAATRASALRVRLPALGGAAYCAARVGDRDRVGGLTREVEQLLALGAPPYEQADALGLLADAWAVVDPGSRGEPYRARSLAVAAAHGFHELVLVGERAREGQPGDDPPHAAVRRPAPVARRVLWALEHLDVHAAEPVGAV